MNRGLVLEPNDLFTADARNVWIDDAGVVEEVPGKALYRGELRDEPGSWVRMSLGTGTLDGMVFTPGEIYFIEPARRFFADAVVDEVIAYRLSDTEEEWSAASCGTPHDQPGPAGPQTGPSSGLHHRAAGSTSTRRR